MKKMIFDLTQDHSDYKYRVCFNPYENDIDIKVSIELMETGHNYWQEVESISITGQNFNELIEHMQRYQKLMVLA
jgi:hypothetical protein